MAPAADDEILEKAAAEASLDYSKWPALIEHVLEKLDHIVHHEFPTPAIPILEPSQQTDHGVEETPQRPIAARPIETPEAKETPSSNQESTQPVLPSSPPLPHPVIPNSQPAEVAAPPGTLPPQLLAFYSAIQSTLKTSFAAAPPFTVQRLSELVLRPRAHYNTLPSYLRALDRIVSVCSTADTFPLPAISDGEGDSSNYLASGGISQNDDFNGAALTRIPWLKDSASMVMSMDRPLGSDLRTESTSIIEGPNGTGSIETVTVNVGGYMSTTPADLAPQPEQGTDKMEEDMAPEQEGEDGGSASRSDEGGDSELVHVRGPEEIGMEDMGPQATRQVGHIFDAEAALGRPGEAEKGTSPNPQTASDDQDEDGDTVVDGMESDQAEAAAKESEAKEE